MHAQSTIHPRTSPISSVVETEDRLPARRPVDLAGDQIPVPQAVVRALDGQRVALFALAQIVDRPLVRQVRFDARDRDREVDRLGDVVVGAEPERLDDVGARRLAPSP